MMREEARRELEWYFTGAEGEVTGLRAASLEGGGGKPFDEAASDRMHGARRARGHRAALLRFERVRSALVGIRDDHYCVLSLAFTHRSRLILMVENALRTKGARVTAKTVRDDVERRLERAVNAYDVLREKQKRKRSQ